MYPVTFTIRDISIKITLFLKKKKLNDFAIFVGANEEIAEKKLIAFSNHLKEHKPLAHKEIQNILNKKKENTLVIRYFSIPYIIWSICTRVT